MLTGPLPLSRELSEIALNRAEANAFLHASTAGSRRKENYAIGGKSRGSERVRIACATSAVEEVAASFRLKTKALLNKDGVGRLLEQAPSTQ